MAVWYWDDWNSTNPTTTTTTGGSIYYSNYSTSGTSTGDWVLCMPLVVYREYLVRCPKAWGEAECAAYVRLINKETNTGFRVTMVIEGDIRITDPNVDVREMWDFLPLVRGRANDADRARIDSFFEGMDLTPPDTPLLAEPNRRPA